MFLVYVPEKKGPQKLLRVYLHIDVDWYQMKRIIIMYKPLTDLLYKSS